ncbi:hypothetical protein LU632_18125 [Erwinia tracheiphila]|nr:hypothetical protein LU632_18125 [Erwinia tracheiphila]
MVEAAVKVVKLARRLQVLMVVQEEPGATAAMVAQPAWEGTGETAAMVGTAATALTGVTGVMALQAAPARLP